LVVAIAIANDPEIVIDAPRIPGDGIGESGYPGENGIRAKTMYILTGS
jgi:hypothetical protein